MSRSFSLYLDAVRFTAAFLVFLWHSGNIHRYDSLWFKLGHESVIVFFVLSGFVIAFCRDTKEKSVSEFFVNRASRIYSVALPAVLITIVLDIGAAQLAPERYGPLLDYPVVRFVSSLLFTNELWGVSIQSFSNVPYWSINYEVWYYILFAALAYAKTWRLGLFVLACIVAGPKIMLLAPCWWMGVWVYRSPALNSLSVPAARWMMFGSVVAFGAYIGAGVSWWGWNALEALLGRELFREFAFSRHFITDYALAVIIGLNFASARVLLRDIEMPANAATRAIRVLAGTTFALYLLHQPFLSFFDALFRGLSLEPEISHFLVSSVCLVIVLTLGYRLENTKQWYRRLFREWLVRMGGWAARFTPGRGSQAG